jgi:hypothetical protein
VLVSGAVVWGISAPCELRTHLDDAVEDGVVVVPAARQLSHVPARLWRVLIVQLDRERALHASSDRATIRDRERTTLSHDPQEHARNLA